MAQRPPFLSAIRIAWARRRQSCELRALSDRYLADAGIECDGIDEFVRANLPWPEAARPEPALAARLQGCG